MTKTLTRSLMVLMLGGLFSQAAMAQDAGTALKTIADIVSSLNHFPSDADKAALAEIQANDSLPQGVRDMANTVANISHSASDEGKEAMARIQANAGAPDSAKELAGIIANISHVASDDAKARLAELYP
ncbi:MAG: hypothetical protein OXU66_16110 [Gammaproteobacteria bacterium]|nr:hypothetical protein [Gammaproteobacteria bacterium]MDD9894255.1 hypothetical protein [Gammaproteobacteria bacterium]MDD9960442.1 hypothetical protein [Gammaproteobacteria bacterium]